MTGTRAPVIGHVLTNFQVPPRMNIQRVLGHWATAGPSSSRVALKLERWPFTPVGPFLSDWLHVPLTLQQSWAEQKLNDGRVGYRWGSLRFHNQLYVVTYWSGPQAPADDRSAVLRALKSIRPAR